MKINLWLTLFIVLLFSSLGAFAQVGPQLSYHGRIVDSTTNLGLNGMVNFKIQIRTPTTSGDNCLLYEETQTKSVTNGVFVVSINNGTGVRTDTSGYSVQQIFSNKNTFGSFNIAGASCTSGNPFVYTPLATDTRRVNILFNDASMAPGVYEPLPTQTIAYVPSAIESLNVGGFPVDALLRVVNGAGAPAVLSPLSNAQYSELMNLITGTSTQYLLATDPAVGFTGSLSGDVSGGQGTTSVRKLYGTPLSAAAPNNGDYMIFNGTQWQAQPGSGGTVTNVSSSNAYLSIVTPSTTPVITVNVGSVANTLAAGNDPRIVGAFQTGTALTSGDLTGNLPSPTVAFVGGKTAAQISTSVTDTINATSSPVVSTLVRRDSSGNATFSTASATNFSGRNVYLFDSTNTNSIQLLASPGLTTSYKLTLPTTTPVNGYIIGTNASGDLSWVNPTAGAVTTVNVAPPLLTSGGFTPTISMPAATTGNNGYLSSMDWTTFNNKQTATLANGQVWVGNVANVATPRNFNITDIKSTFAPFNPWFNVAGGCLPGDTLTYSAITDVLSCTAYSLTTAQVTTALGYTPPSNNLAAGNIFVGNTSNVATGVPLSGDATMSASGDLTIVNSAITTAKIANGAITDAKVAAGINWSKITSTPTTIFGYGITDAVLINAGGVTSIEAGTLAALPAPGTFGRMYVTSDSGEIYRDNGVSWTKVGSATGLGGTVTTVTGTSPLSVSNNTSTPVISMTQATAAVNGYLGSTDFSIFAAKLGTASVFSGDVTGVYNNLALINSGVVAGNNYTKFNVDAKGRVTSATNINSTDVTTALGFVPATNTLPNGYVFIGDPSNAATPRLVSGDFSVTNTGTAIITNNAITTAKIANGAVTDAQVSAGINWSKITSTPTTIAGYGILDAVLTNAGGVTSMQAGTLAARPAPGSAGRMYVTTDTAEIYRDTGISWYKVGSATGLGGTVTSVSAAPGTVFTVFNSTTTPIISMNQADNLGSDGYLRSADFVTFFNKIDQSAAFSGDVSGTYNSIVLNNSGVVAGNNFSKFNVDSKGRVTSASVLVSSDITGSLGYTPVNKTGDTMSGALAMGGNNISGTGNILMNASKYISIGQFAADPATGGWGAAEEGRSWYNTTAKVLKYWDGSAIKVIANTAGAISQLNGLTTQSQDFTVGSAGTDFNISSAVATHTFNIPTVGTGGALRGLLGSTDYTTFAAKIGPATTFSGDVSGTYNTINIAKLQGQTLTMAAPSTGNYLRYTGAFWQNANLVSSDITTSLGFVPATSALANTKIFIGNAGGIATAQTLSGDASLANDGTLTLTNTAVTPGTYGSASSVPTFTVDSKGRLTSASGQAYQDATGAAKGIVRIGANITLNSGTISITSTDITNALTYTPATNALPNAQVFIGNASGVATNQTIAGDATLSNDGTLSINNNAITTNKIANGAVTDAKVANGINWSKITSTPTSIAGYGIQDAILTNAGGVTSMQAGTLAARPAFGTVGRMYVTTDTGEIYRDTGGTWDKVGSAAGLGGTVTNVTGSSPISVINNTSTPVISMTQVSGAVNGYLGSTDYTSFLAKLGPATVFSGDVTGVYNSLVLNNTGVVAGNNYTKFNVDAKGRVTSATNINSTDVTNALTYVPATSVLPDGYVFIGNASNAATPRLVSGDFSVTNTGSAVITNSAITTAKVNNLAITDAKINDVNWTKVTGTPTTIAGYGITNGVTNVGVGATSNVSSFQAGTLAGRPAFGTAGRMYVATDTGEIYRDTGGAWTKVGSATGTGGTVTSVSAAPGTVFTVFNSTSTPIITMNQADGTSSGGSDVDGYLTAANFNLFYNKIDQSAAFSGDVSGTYNNIVLKNTGVVPGTYTKVTVDSKGRVTGNVALNSGDITTGLSYVPVNKAGDLMTGSLAIGGAQVATSLLTLTSTNQGFLMPRMTSAQRNAIVAPALGLQVFDTNLNAMYYYNGGSWLAVANTTGSISQINGLTTQSQDFSVGSAGTDFNISSAVATHTFNIPTVGTGALRGLLGSTDYTTFAAKIGPATTFSGDVSGTYNTINIAKLQGQTLTLGAPSTGNYLRYTGAAWQNANLVSTDITTALTFVPISNALANTKIFIGNAGGVATAQTVSGDAALSNDGTLSINNNAITTAKVANLAITDAKINDVNWSKVTGTPTTVAGYGITNAVTNVGVGTTSYVSSFQAGTLGALPGFGTAGRMYVATDTGEIYRDNGGAWIKVGSANGLGGTVTSVTGTAPLSVTNTTTTPVISMTQAAAGVNGYLGSTDYSTFSAKLGPATTFSGDVSGTYNTMSVDKLRGTALSIAGLASGNFLRYNGTNWANSNLNSTDVTGAFAGGIFPVSVGGTGANTLTSNGVLLGNGTSAVTATAAGANNSVLRVPAGGGAPVFGAIDLSQSAAVTNTLAVANGGTGATTFGTSSLLMGNGAGAVSSFLPGSAGNVIYGTAATTWGAGTPDTAGLVDKSSVQAISGAKTFGATVKMSNQNLFQLGDAAAGTISFKAPAAVTSYTLQWPAAVGSAGQVLSTSSSGDLSWVSTSTGTVTNVTGTSPISVANGTSTPVISMTQAAAGVNGYLGSTDYSTFSAKLGPATVFSGDVSGTYNTITITNNAITTAKVNNLAITDAKINDVNWSKVTGTPTTIAGYGITNAVTNVGVGATSYVSSFQAGTLAGRPAFGTAGRMYVATDTGEIYRDTGGAWTKVGSATGTGGTVTSVSAAPGTVFSVFNSTTTPIITMNQADGTSSGGSDVDGYLTAANFNLFYNKLDQAATFSGDISGAYNAISVNRIKGTPLSIAGLTNGQYLRYNGTNWANSNIVLVSTDVTSAFAGGIFPVSVGGTGANTLTSNGVLLGNGTSAVTATAAGAANTVLRVPSGGGAPVFGAIDLSQAAAVTNTLAVANGGTGATTFTTSSLLMGNGAGAVSSFVPGSAGNVIYGTAATTWGAGTPDTAGLVDKSSVQAIAGAKTFGATVKMSNQNLFQLGDAAAGTISFKAPAAVTSYTLQWPAAVGSAGQFLSTSSSGDLSWVSASTGTVTNVSGTSPISVATGTTTPVISMTQAAAGVNGYLGSTDYSTFSAKLGPATTFSGDVTGTSSTMNIAKLQGQTLTMGAPSTGNYLRYTGAAWQNANLVSTDITTALTYVPISSSLASTKIFIGNAGGVATAQTVSGDAALSNDGTLSINNNAITTAKVANLAITDAKINDVNWSKVTGTPTTIAGYGITNGVTNVGVGTTTNVSSFQAGAVGAIPAFGTPGRMYVATDSGEIYRDNGGAWIKVGSATGLGGTVTSVTGTAPISVTNTTTTPVISMTQAAAGVNGYLGSTDYSTFSAKLGPATVFSGDVSGTSTTMSVDRIKGTALSIAGLANNQYLRYNGTNWVNSNIVLVSTDVTSAFAGGIFPVSVGGTGANTLTSNGVLLGNGTSAVTATAAGANYSVLRVPAGGGAPVFGAIDLSQAAAVTNTLAVANGGTGATTFGTSSLLMGNGAGVVSSFLPGSAGNVIYGTAATTWGAGTPDTAGLVDKSSVQAIAGAKTFGATVKMSNQNLFQLGDSGAGIISFKAPTTVTSYTLQWPAAVGSAGQVLSTSSSGDLSWISPASGTVTSVTGTAPISVTNTTSTPVISMTQAAAGVNGYLGSTDYSTFAAKLGTSSVFSGDVSGTSTTMSVDRIKGTALSIAGLATNQYLRYNGTNWVNSNIVLSSTDVTGAFAGNVFPVTVGGTGLTSGTSGGIPYFNSATTMASSGVLATNGVVLGGGAGATPTTTAAGAANTVLRVPAGGGAPVFGAIDLSQAAAVTNTLAVANGGTGATTFGTSSLLMGNGAGAVSSFLPGSAGNVIYGTAATTWGAGTPDTAGLVDKSSVQAIAGAKTFGATVKMSNQNLFQLGDAAAGTISFKAPTAVTSYTLQWPAAVGSAGQVLSTSSSGDLSWISPASGTVTSVTGTAPISVATGTTTPVISMTQAAAGVNGYLGSTDYSTFSAKLGPATVFSGDVTGTSTTMSVDRIRGTALSIAGLATNQYLRYNGTNWVNSNLVIASTDVTGAFAGGIFPVSVGGTGANTLTSNGVLLGNGTSAVTATAAGANNSVLRVPAGGGAPVFGAIDLSQSAAVTNTLAVANGGTGATTFGTSSLLMGNGAGAVSSFLPGSAGNVIYGTAATTWGAGTPDTAGLVDKSSVQAISGAKTFGATVKMSNQNLFQLGDAAAGTISFKAPAAVTSYTLQWPAAVGSAGQFLSTSSSGDLSWVTPSFGTVTTVTGTAPISVTNTTTTPVISMTQAAAGVNGYLGSTDYSTFAAKLGTSSVFSGDVSGTSTTMSVDRLRGTALSIAGLATNQYLRYNGTNWANSNIVLSSTDVTGAFAGSIFPVSVGGTGANTLTSNGVLLGNGTSAVTATAAGANNSVLRVPAGGGAPVFGAIDLSQAAAVTNTLAVANGGTGRATLTSGSVLVGNGVGTVNYLTAVSANDVIYATGAGAFAVGNRSTAGIFAQGGNAFAATATLGTTDANSLNLVTGGTVRASFDNSGGATINASTGLQVNGQAYSTVATSAAATTLPWDANTSNVMRWTTANSGLTVNITNMRAGAAYMLVIKGAGVDTVTITCAGTGVSSATPLYVPANGNRVGGTANSKTVYTIMADGENCLVTWITGY